MTCTVAAVMPSSLPVDMIDSMALDPGLHVIKASIKFSGAS